MVRYNICASGSVSAIMDIFRWEKAQHLVHAEAGGMFVHEGLLAVGDHRFQVKQSNFAI